MRRTLLPVLVLMSQAPAVTRAASPLPTDIAIGDAVLQPSVKRLGINLGTPNFYDSGQLMKNLISRNPGFEGEIDNSTVRCISGTATSCTDENASSAWTADFWRGATFEIFWGAASGRTGSVATYRAAAAGKGGVFTFSGPGKVPSKGDYMIVHKRAPGGATAGWWPVTKAGATITTETRDLPPHTTGHQAVRVTALAPGQSASLGAYFDTVQDRSFVQLNGTFELTFRAKSAASDKAGNENAEARPGIQVSITRLCNPSHVYVSRVEPLAPPGSAGNGWSTHSITFHAAETGTSIGSVSVSFSTVGQESFLLDDVSLVQTNGDSSNKTAFRDPVVKALRTLKPGVLRFWATQLGDTLDNLIADPFGRERAGFSAWSPQQDDISYGLPAFLQLCQAVGAEPWFVVPATFTTADAANLIEYLAGGPATPYGGKRVSAGEKNPWTQSFAKIHLEFGNEAWNGTFKGGAIEYPQAYGSRAQTIFAAMRKSPAYSASAFDLVLGGQEAWPGRNADIQNNCNNNDSFTVGPYLMNTVDSYAADEQLFGSTFAEPEALLAASGIAEGSTGGLMVLNQKALRASAHPVPLEVYEVNMSTLGGSITEKALSTYEASLGAGLAIADEMLQQMRAGVLIQNLFALPQYQFKRADGARVDLWGSVVDMGVTDRKRPQFLAVQLANEAIGGSAATPSRMLRTLHSGADPTWNQPLTNTVQLKGAHDLQSFAFQNGNKLSLVVFNLERTAALPVTFSGPNAPQGTIQIRELTSAHLTDTNETSDVIQIHARTISVSSSSPSSSPTMLPPHSMTAFLWERR